MTVNPVAHDISDRRFFRYVPAVIISAILILFVFGIIRLFLLRFNIGDVYPAYSTYRSDPLGAKAFYESLSVLDGMHVSRNVKSLSTIADSRHTTFFFPGAEVGMIGFISKDAIQSFNDLVLTGGRLVISFFPLQELPLAEDRKSYSEKFSADVLTTQWGVSFASENKSPDAKRINTARRKTQANLPEEIMWRSSLFFDQLHPSWKIIYTLDEKPVIIERPFGKGTIVLASDSYLFSNEALSKDRHPALLAWFVQNNRSVVFDEYHFGVRHKPGLMHLIRKYNFHGILFGLLIMAALFIWKSAMPLVPPGPPVFRDRQSGAGKDHIQGLISLLRRNVDEKELLKICFDEWKKTVGKNKHLFPEQIQNRMRDAAREHYRSDSVRGYREISGILKKR